ncbi:MAG: hypothetical protein U0354_20180 [Candidatus Sericytochromatia bacterium]
MVIPEIDIIQATYESIYWWNRDEYYYHYYFSRLGVIHKDKKLMAFFTSKVFDMFLREYAVRRNISEGYRSVDTFLNDIIKHRFINEVKNGNPEIIDTVSNELKTSSDSTTRQTISLLSKIAFLINPNTFSLCDTFTKDSLHKLIEDKKIKRIHLDKYTVFKAEIDKMRLAMHEKNLFAISNDILKEFKATEAGKYFKIYKQAFELRVIDKLLWLLAQPVDNRKVDNQEYLKFISLE